MPILKAESSALTPQPYSMRDIEKQAAALLTRAKQQADALLAEAQRQAAVLRTQGHEQGVREGKLEGIKQGKIEGAAAGKQQALAESKQQVAQLVQSLTAVSQQIEASRQHLLSAADGDVARLAIAIARKIVHRLAPDPAEVSATIADAMKFVVGQNDVKIAIHPSQEAMLRESLPALQMTIPSLKHVEIAADETIAPGGARIITRHGQVDATLDAMIDRIATELISTVEGEAPAEPAKS